MRLKIKFSILSIVLLSALQVNAQDLGVGLRLGDPTGVTVKKYFGDNALEISLGKPAYWSGYDWGYYYSHDNRYKNKLFVPAGYSRDFNFGVAINYLFHKDLDFGNLPNLKWYWGVGGQFRMNSGKLFYFDASSVYRSDRVTDIDIGPDATIGLEMTFDNIPVSVFLDLTGFIEIVNRFNFYPQGGIGVRYNF